MITTILRSVLENTSTLQTKDHYLYLVGDEEVVLYIGRSWDPVHRLHQHLGLTWRPGSRLETLFETYRTLALQWYVRLYTIGDCKELVQQYIVPKLGPLYSLDRYLDPVHLDASVGFAEQALIEHYHPCLNDRFNDDPTPLPERYERDEGGLTLRLSL